MATIKTEHGTFDEKAVVKEIEDMYTEGYNLRKTLDGQWWLNIAFFMGKQYVYYERLTDRLKEPKAPPWRVRATLNEIFPRVLKEVSRLLQNRPQAEVFPLTSEDSDIEAARYGNKILSYLDFELDMRLKTLYRTLWQVMVGTVFEKVFWDKTAGRYAGGGLHEGQVGTDIVPPCELIIDPQAKMLLDEANWVIHVKSRPIDYIEGRYGIKVEGTEASFAGLLESKLATLLGTSFGKGKERYVLVKELWQLPCKKYPQGRFVTIGGEKILEPPQPFPYEHKQLPFIPYIAIPVPGRFWGMSKIEQSIPTQKEINKTISSLIENKNLMANPKWKYPEGGLDTPPDNEPGENIVYNPIPGLPSPEPVQMPSVPFYVFKILEILRLNLDHIWSQHEISRAQVPPRIESGIAIQFLQESDILPMAPPVLSIEESTARSASQRLALISQYYNERRVIRVMGEDRRPETFDWKPGLLRGNTDVRVRGGSALPETRSAKRAFLLSLWNMRVLNEPRQFLKLLEFDSFEQLYTDFEMDAEQAKRENKLMATGKVVEVKEWHNQTIHLHEHNKFRKGEVYEALSPGEKALVDGHCKGHEDFISAKLAEAQPPTPTLMGGKR
ncbi:MAG: hypothetical protein QMD08_08200 [Actinomycetota bacterium]|nr:hypothetical protein [Actinomycetota bacterium]